MDFKVDTIALPEVDVDSEDGGVENPIVFTVCEFVDLLRQCYFEFDELPEQAVQVYWLSYYVSQLHNGGPAQFVFNSRWDPVAVDAVDSGLEALGAGSSSRLYKELITEVQALGDDLQTLLNSAYFGKNPVRDRLNVKADEFLEAVEQEDLLARANDYIAALPNVRFFDPEAWEAEMMRLARTLPNPQERADRAASNEHWHEKYARSLSELVGEKFDRITGMEIIDDDGIGRPFIHFFTDKGHRVMLLARGIATMADHDRNGKPMAEWPCPEAVAQGDEEFIDFEPRVFPGASQGIFGRIARLFGS